MNLRTIALLGIVSIALTACGDAKENEAKRLGFSSYSEMESVQAKGWHTNAQYLADETERAKRLGFINADELHDAESEGIIDPVAYRKYKADQEAREAAQEARDAAAENNSAKDGAESDAQPATEPEVSDNSGGGPGFFGSLLGKVGLSEAKNVITSSCENLASATGETSMSQMKQVFGEPKVTEWCECTYNTMAKKYSDNDLASAPDAGALNETASAIKRDIYLVTASCMDRSSVPAKGQGLKKDFAGVLRATVAMGDAMK